MIDKINAEADAIGCGKDEKIKALEELLKIAIRERDEALAYSERLLCAWEAVKSTDWDEPMNEIINEQPPAALAALKAEWQADVVDLAIDQLNKAGYTLTQPQSHAIELLRSLADSIRQQAHVTK